MLNKIKMEKWKGLKEIILDGERIEELMKM